MTQGVVATYGCGGSCLENGLWQEDPDAWQWTAQLGIVAAGCVLLLVGGYFASTGKRAIGLALIGLSILVAVGWYERVLQWVSLT